jgi:hypothetical protein
MNISVVRPPDIETHSLLLLFPTAVPGFLDALAALGTSRRKVDSHQRLATLPSMSPIPSAPFTRSVFSAFSRYWLGLSPAEIERLGVAVDCLPTVDRMRSDLEAMLAAPNEVARLNPSVAAVMHHKPLMIGGIKFILARRRNQLPRRPLPRPETYSLQIPVRAFAIFTDEAVDARRNNGQRDVVSNRNNESTWYPFSFGQMIRRCRFESLKQT